MTVDVNKGDDLQKKAQYKVPFGTVSMTNDAKALINSAIDNNWLTRGPLVRDFEIQFAKLFNVKEAIAVSSGTDADAICCAALYDFGAQRGDEIIVPASTFIASANAILQAGFKPVFVDINRHTLNIDPEKIEQAITAKTRAIMLVHLMGKPAAMKEILAIAKKHHLRVIEDTAEAHGARYNDQLCGTMGDMAAFSLYAAHIITTVEGGIIITNNEKIAHAARSLRNHGMEGKFTASRIGFSSKMNEMEAAVGLGNIKIFDHILNTRRRNLLYLIEKFHQYEEFFIVLKEEKYEKIGPHAFSIIVKEQSPFKKNQFVQFLDDNGVDSRNLFYSIPTQCPSYEFLGYQLGDFPEAEFCSNNGTHIGIHQDLSIEQLDYVVQIVDKFLEQF